MKGGTGGRRSTRLWTISGVLLTTLGCGPRHDSPLKPNELVFAVAPDSILEVEYKSAQQRIVAHRWSASDVFVVTFERAEGRTFERCKADERILASLHLLASIRATKSVSVADAGQATMTPSAWGTLSIRDETLPEATTFLVRPGAPALARSFGSDATFELENNTLSLLREGCPDMSAR